jgi:hypothetical protein
MEHLTKDERPPEHIWEDVEGLNEWWAHVEERRATQYGTGRSVGAGDDDEGSQQPKDMAQNEIAKQLRK